MEMGEMGLGLFVYLFYFVQRSEESSEASGWVGG